MRKRNAHEIVRHEEELLKIDKAWRGAGYLKARKLVDRVKLEEAVPRDVEELEYRTVPAGDAEDSGEIETLPDGSLSIPVYAEELIVTKRIVLKERVIISKRTVTETERIRVDLRRERVSIDADPGIEVTTDPTPQARPAAPSEEEEA
jgi:uncharacterized protein (TIGR02271 family)